MLQIPLEHIYMKMITNPKTNSCSYAPVTPKRKCIWALSFIEDFFHAFIRMKLPITWGPIPVQKVPLAQKLMNTNTLFQDDTLQAMKMSLNHVKKQLGEKDIAVWHNHTSNTNPSQKISYAVKRRAQPEMVTQVRMHF